MSSLKSIGYHKEKKRMMGIPTDAAAVPDGERKENQKITGVTMDDYIIVPCEV